jgi:magnesium chelatase family protein
MLATVQSAALHGIKAVPVQVEVNSGESGDPRLILVGLPDAAVKESNDRVFSALSTSGFRPPRTRTTINLAPGDLRKEGPIYDLPIALGILASTQQMTHPSRLESYVIAGELGLSGATRPVRGALAMAILAKENGKEGILLPPASAKEAALVEGLSVISVETLEQAYLFLENKIELKPLHHTSSTQLPTGPKEGIDFHEIKGQLALRRAVEIAVAGGHNLIMIGPPGSGKSMIAKRIPDIMPKPSLNEFLEILSIHSAAGKTLDGTIKPQKRPYRSPHHTISDVGLLGGGTIPGPGEISLAHNGVLFLDELPEFKRSALEVLRQPLEDRSVTISRSAGKITLPCGFILVAAMNPCPCGYLGDPKHECRCSPTQIQRYRSRISGPLLDRIDIHIEAPALSIEELRSEKPGESSEVIRTRIEVARQKQSQRFSQNHATTNAQMSLAQIREHCSISDELGNLLQQAMEQLSLSARAYDRILKVARTIADLEEAENIQPAHLMEAIQYRSLDRNLFY